MAAELAGCPKYRLTCVCSRPDALARHRVRPFAVNGEPAVAMGRLKALLAETPRTRVVAAVDDRVRAESRSRLGFVDEIDLRLCREDRVIHVRSASRCRWCLHDLGVNRQRVEDLRRRYEAASGGLGRSDASQ